MRDKKKFRRQFIVEMKKIIHMNQNTDTDIQTNINIMYRD